MIQSCDTKLAPQEPPVRFVPQVMEVFDNFPNIEQPDVASTFLYTFSTETRISESFLPSLEICTTCLTRDPMLHAKLKIAHETRDIEGIEWFRGA